QTSASAQKTLPAVPEAKPLAKPMLRKTTAAPPDRYTGVRTRRLAALARCQRTASRTKRPTKTPIPTTEDAALSASAARWLSRIRKSFGGQSEQPVSLSKNVGSSEASVA